MNGFYITPEQYAAAAENGISARTLELRYRDYGWEMDRAISTPVRKQGSNGKWPQVAKENGISYSQFSARVRLGWSAEKAATTPTMSLQETAAHARSLRGVEPLVSPEIKALAKANGISKSTLQHRITKQKMDPVEAATRPTARSLQV
jgi:hypothetical protein